MLEHGNAAMARLDHCVQLLNTGESLPGYKFMLLAGHGHVVDEGNHSLFDIVALMTAVTQSFKERLGSVFGAVDSLVAGQSGQQPWQLQQSTVCRLSHRRSVTCARGTARSLKQVGAAAPWSMQA